jgi:glycosyltransferase involved in cell wall biosynthesis
VGRLSVLVVHHRPERGGAGEALARLLGALRDRVDAVVLTPRGPAAELFSQAGAEVRTAPAAGFTHIWASTYTGARWALVGREAVRLPGHAHALRSLLRTRRFDVVHLNDSPLVPAAWLAHRAGLPVVWHLRSALPEAPSRRSAVVRRAVATLATSAVAINDDVAASFDVGAEVVHDPVDLARFRPDGPDARKRLALGAGDVAVGFFGYLYPAKGFRELLDAAERIAGNDPRVVWLLAGGGVRPPAFYRRAAGAAAARSRLAPDYAAEAAAIVRARGLDGRVRLLPYRDDVPDLMRACDVVVVPSRGPEIGLPALEAAASGVPVVATGTATGAGVVVPDETGVLVPGGGGAELAAAVLALARDPERRRALGRAARAHAERRFDADLVADRVAGVWAAAAAKGRDYDPPP